MPRVSPFSNSEASGIQRFWNVSSEARDWILGIPLRRFAMTHPRNTRARAGPGNEQPGVCTLVAHWSNAYRPYARRQDPEQHICPARAGRNSFPHQRHSDRVNKCRSGHPVSWHTTPLIRASWHDGHRNRLRLPTIDAPSGTRAQPGPGNGPGGRLYAHPAPSVTPHQPARKPTRPSSRSGHTRAVRPPSGTQSPPGTIADRPDTPCQDPPGRTPTRSHRSHNPGTSPRRPPLGKRWGNRRAMRTTRAGRYPSGWLPHLGREAYQHPSTNTPGRVARVK